MEQSFNTEGPFLIFNSQFLIKKQTPQYVANNIYEKNFKLFFKAIPLSEMSLPVKSILLFRFKKAIKTH
jgi:hypothetical protein